MIKYRVIAISETGPVRDNNEDNLYLNGEWRHGSEVNVPYWHYLSKTTDASLFVVCDGMGGESYGEEASLIAVSGLSAIEDRLRHSSKQSFADLMQSYLLMVNQEICERIRFHNGLRMGTTFSSLLIRQKTARCINLGDSRIYLYRQGKLKQLTVDQTQAQKLADLGLIQQKDVKTHPEHNRLVQHLGIFPNEYKLEPALSPDIDIQEGDYFLLCSDGLTDMLTDESIRKILSKTNDIKLIAEDLVQKAFAAGGKDNITVILVAIDALSDERLMKTGQMRIIDDNYLSKVTQPKFSQDTREDPLLRMKLNKALINNYKADNLLLNHEIKTREIGAALSEGQADESPFFSEDAEIKHLGNSIGNLNRLQKPYLNYQKLEEQQALAEAEIHEKKAYKIKNKFNTLVDLPLDKGKNQQIGNGGENLQSLKSNLNEESTKGENVLITRVTGSDTDARSLIFFAENRLPVEPITTDDLKRFELARQEAMKRQASVHSKINEHNTDNQTSDVKRETNTGRKNIVRLTLLIAFLSILLVLIGCFYWFYNFDCIALWQDLKAVWQNLF